MNQHLLENIKRVVVKVGTKLLVNENGRLDGSCVDQIAREVSWIINSGRETVMVTSGAIVAGVESMGLKTRPKTLPDLQAAAAVGQSQLMHFYQTAFSKYGITIAQVLLTAEDLKERRRHINAKNTFEALLSKKILPIVNENDTVAVEEIRFGDNDLLSALVANLVQSDLLILLTDQDGFLKEGAVVPTVFEINKELESFAYKAKDWKGIGGMKSKLDAAKVVMRSGEFMIIANGRKKGIAEAIFNQRPAGTLFIPKAGKMSGKKRWIAHFSNPQGALYVDDGALHAICEKGKSLLLPGIREIEGSFKSGDTVRVLGPDYCEVARGLVNYPAKELERLIGKSSDECLKILGVKPDEIIHRDNLVIL